MSLETETAALLNTGLEALGVRRDRRTIDKFTLFLDELLLWNRKTNLVGAADAREIIIRHVFDSLSIHRLMEEINGSILDIGAGAGFPSVPLAIVNDSIEIHAAERRRKRAAFLRAVQVILGLSHFTVIERDVREITGRYDVMLARGVGELEYLHALSKRLLKEKSMIIAFKGKLSEIEKEVSKLKTRKNLDKDVSLQIQKVDVPYLEEEERNIVIIKTK